MIPVTVSHISSSIHWRPSSTCLLGYRWEPWGGTNTLSITYWRCICGMFPTKWKVMSIHSRPEASFTSPPKVVVIVREDVQDKAFSYDSGKLWYVPCLEVRPTLIFTSLIWSIFSGCWEFIDTFLLQQVRNAPSYERAATMDIFPGRPFKVHIANPFAKQIFSIKNMFVAYASKILKNIAILERKSQILRDRRKWLWYKQLER